MAVYQAAVVSEALEKNPALRAADIRLPHEIALHAANTSVVRFHGRLRIAIEKGAWEQPAPVLAER